jgi:serine protease
MLHRLPAAVMAALFIFGAIAAPAPARAVTAAAPVAPEPFDSLTVRFAYNTTVGTAMSDDGKTRQIDLKPGQDAETALAAWEQAPGVVGVIPDIRAFPTIDPIDPYFASQWDMHVPTTGKEGAANAAAAWGTTTGAGVVVAVLDTGQVNHPDLIANTPEGWGVDMIENSATAGDDNPGRDTDPTDEGDWTSYTDENGKTYLTRSSWHGTHVAGTIGAAQNDIGISGVAPNVSILHVRVLGHGGGTFDDIIDGIRWASGLTTSWDGRLWSAFGLPNNSHPADIINLSLGGYGIPCYERLQTSITQARAAGAVIVVAAGNLGADVALAIPANCNDTVTVAAIGRVGGRAGYSNHGAGVDIAAPGGDMPRDSGVLSTIATGTTTLTGYGYANYHGTSMAAPHVAGVAALVASLHPTWGPNEIEAAIYAGARPFPADSLRPCVTTSETPTGSQRQCGAGLLDAVGALNMAQPTLTITAPERLAVGESATVSAASDLAGVVTLAVASASAANCTLSGETLSAAQTGTCTLNATTPTTADHIAASATFHVTITGTPQSVIFGVGPLLTETDVPFGTTPPTLTATASSGLPVSYEISTPTICEALAPDGLVNAWRLRLLNVGTCTVRATQAGNAIYERASSIERSFTIVQGSQTIELEALADRTFDPTVLQELPRFSSANLPLNYSGLSSSVCEPRFNGTGFELHLLKPGTCTIRAEQEGTSTYRAADSVIRTFEVFRGTQALINFGTGPLLAETDVPFGTTPPTLTATASSGLPVSYEISTPTICEALAPDGLVNAWRLRLLNVGTCTVRATQAGNSIYERASSVERSFTIVQGSQTIELDALADRAFDPTVLQELPRFSSANLPLNYSGLSISVCEPRSNGTGFELHIFKLGTCTIRAEQDGTSTYRAADSVIRTFEVFRGTQAPLILDAGSSAHVVNSTRSYAYGGGSSSAPFIATSVTPTICTVIGRNIRYLKVGTCIVRGVKDGNALYEMAYTTISVTVFVPARVTVIPRIRQVGKIVYGTRGTWVGSPTPNYKYQWYSCTTAQRTRCSVISGATSVNLKVTSKIAGKYAFLRVTMYQYGSERARRDSNVIRISAK